MQGHSMSDTTGHNEDTLNPDATLQENFRAIPVNSPAWQKAYPMLGGFLEGRLLRAKTKSLRPQRQRQWHLG